MDLPLISSILNSSIKSDNLRNPADSNTYSVTPSMIKEKIFISKYFFTNGSFIASLDNQPVGFLLSKLCSNSVKEYKNTAHISLFAVKSDFKQKGIGKLLYKKFEEQAFNQSVLKIIIGQDLDNIYSGTPDFSSPKIDSEFSRNQNKSVNFFENLGFIVSKGKNFDLSNDLSNYQFNTKNLHICTSDDYSTILAKKTDIPQLKSFMQKEFSGRWEYEVTRTFETTELNHIVLLKENEKINGFCRIRYDFDTNFNEFFIGTCCGALGPIGIAKSARGLGLGNRLLLDSLKMLQNLGAKNTNIDWTDLLRFYSQFGFKPWRSFFSAEKTL